MSPTMKNNLSRVGWLVVAFLMFVALSSVFRRFTIVWPVLIGEPAGPLASNVFENRYLRQPVLSLVHILAGGVFMITGPTQFISAIRKRWPGVHRTMGWIYLTASAVAVTTALMMVPLLPVFGTFTSKASTTLASVVFIVCLVQAVRHIRHRRIRQHREWMIRGYALGMGIATFRVLLGVLLTSGVPFTEAWDTVMSLSFSINLLIAECWINITRHPEKVSGTPRAKIPVTQSIG